MNPYFVCYGWDYPDKLHLRLTHRQAHLDRVLALDREGRIKVGGPMLQKEGANPQEAGFAGSLLIAQFDNLVEAKAWWQSDPYVIHGVFKDWGVCPYIVAFPK